MGVDFDVQPDGTFFRHEFTLRNEWDGSHPKGYPFCNSSSIGRQHNAAIPPSMRGLDPFCEIDFAVSQRCSFTETGISVAITGFKHLQSDSWPPSRAQCLSFGCY